MAAHVATAHVQNGRAYVTIALNGAPAAESHALVAPAFAGLGVEYDALANSAHSMCVGNYFTYSQAVPA